MKISGFSDRTGLGTMGLTGIVIVAGVIWGQISPWWLLLGVTLVSAGIGSEAGVRKE